MSWSASILAGVLTGAVGLIVGGLVASLAASWYHVPSFEAQSAAFVIGIAILAGFVGFLIGVITSRVTPDPGFWKVLGSSNGILLAIIAVGGGGARLLADVPPTIDGEQLMLAVEIRWPASHTTSPASLPGEPTLTLGSITRMSHTQRATSKGPLWTSDAKLVDGRWVAPGAVDIFTTRGRFSIVAMLDSTNNPGFILPLSGRPTKKDFQWTEWYPHAKPGAPPLADGFQYRYRVQKRSEPVRTETIGPFDVQTIAYYFADETYEQGSVLSTFGVFAINYRGKPVTVDAKSSDSTSGGQLDRADGVAMVGGPRPALLAHFTGKNTDGACYVLTDESDRLRTVFVPECSAASGSILTSDTAAFRKAERKTPRGRIDRVAFQTPGLYSVGRSVLDSRRLTVHPYNLPEMFSIFPDVPPLGIAPDERSFVRFGSHYAGENQTSLAVANFADNHSYLLPVDEARMRYATLDAIDPAWLMHHFAWQKGSNGVDSLVERKDFVPLPYHFRNTGTSGYWLEPASQPLRDALIDFIVTEFKGEKVAVESYAYEYPVKIGGDTINVAYGDSGHYVSLSLPRGGTDTKLLEAIVHRFDTALATGKYDDMFGK